MRNKQLTLLLTLLMSMVASVVSAYDAQIDGIYYNFSGSNATVTYESYTNGNYVSDYEGDIVIPSTVTYAGRTYTVTSIRNYAFRNCSSLTSINIPEGVTYIGDYAFYN